jgi:pimeloyl-ACP methyl ester carboxylesterase
MLIGADGDNFSPPAVIQKMAEAIGDVRVSIAAQTGHMIPLERPAWLARQIEYFYG